MACHEWNDGWVAAIYDEIDADERAAIERHLELCADCRATLDGLRASRAALRSSAPAVPPAPRLVALPAPRWQRPVWSFAAGIAFALVLVGAGAVVGQRTGWPANGSARPDAGEIATAIPSGGTLTRAEVEAMLRRQQREFDRRLEQVAASTASTASTAGRDAPGGAAEAAVTRADLDHALNSLERRMKAAHASDVAFVLEELDATEARAANWFDENREALMMVALKNDPRFSER